MTVDLPPTLLDQIHKELASGEQLIWTGQPRGQLPVWTTIGSILLGLIFLAVAVFWVIGWDKIKVDAPNIPLPIPPGVGKAVFFSVFLGLGLWFVSMPLWWRIPANKTWYALTSSRLMVCSPPTFWPFREGAVRNFGPLQIAAMERKRRSDGSGDLVLESKPFPGVDWFKRRIGLPNVRDVEAVEKLIRAALPFSKGSAEPGAAPNRGGR